MGRVVETHSTHIDGLISKLRQLALNKGIKTITPAVIKRVKGKCDKMKMRVTVDIKGGFKVIVRKGYLAQEVFILTEFNRRELEDIIRKI